MDKIEYLECACYSPEHRLVFKYIKDETYEDYPELYTEVHLHQPNNIFKRIWIAIKYIFGYKSKYGCFDCFILRPQDAWKLRQLGELIEKEYKEWIKQISEKKNDK